MNNARKQQAQPQAQPQPPAVPQRPRPPPPPRADTRYPSEDEIRAGMNYRHAPPPTTFSPEETPSAWAKFNATNVGKPGMARTNTTRAPRRAGFDPTAQGADERQAGHTANYTNRPRPGEVGATPPVPPPPFPFPPPPPRQPTRPNIFGQPAPLKPDVDAPYAEGTRIRTPYTSHIGEKTFFSSDQLKRSQSTADTTKMHNVVDDEDVPERHRSASPPKQKNEPHSSRRKPFVVYSSSESSQSESESTNTTPEPDRAAKPVPAEGNPFLQNFDRPKKTPTPPSARANATSGPIPADTNANAANSADNNGKPSMYDKFPFVPLDATLPSDHWSEVFPFGSKNLSSSATRRKSSLPSWAIPSTVNIHSARLSASRRSSSQQARRAQTADCLTSGSLQQSSMKASRYEDIFAAKDSHTVAHTQGDFGRDASSSPSSPQRDRQATLQAYTNRIFGLSDHPLRFPCIREESAANICFRFSIPLQNDSSAATGASKVRSEENINTAFSASDWSGTFTSTNANGIFAVPRKSSPLKRGRETLSARTSRMNINDDKSRMPPPPIATTNLAQGPDSEPTSAPPDGRFAPDQWKNSSWDFSPAVSRPATSAGDPQLRRSSRSVHNAQTAQQTNVPDNAAPASNDVPTTDAMDIDTDPPPPTQSKPQESSGARLYSVPPSAWRQSQGGAVTPEAMYTGRNASAAQVEQRGVNLDGLGQTLNENSANGFDGIKEMSGSLPFASRPSTTVPTKSSGPSPAPFPQIPLHPSPPIRLNKASWKDYCEQMAGYMKAFYSFDLTMHKHFEESLRRESALVGLGPSALEAVGQGTNQEVGWVSYSKRLKEDERFRECWSLAQEKHLDAVKKFTAVKERVRALSEGPGLADA